MRGVLILLSLLGLCFLVSIVSADMAAPPNYMTVVHLEKDGIPYNGSLTFSLNCYGHFSEISRTGSSHNLTGDRRDPMVRVLSVSHPGDRGRRGYYWDFLTESCMVNGSVKVEEYCYTGHYFKESDPRQSEFCQLNGSSKTGSFSVWNDSDKPVTRYSRGARMERDYYEFFFTLPQDFQTTYLSDAGKSPVESLYCSLLSLIGSRC